MANEKVPFVMANTFVEGIVNNGNARNPYKPGISSERHQMPSVHMPGSTLIPSHLRPTFAGSAVGVIRRGPTPFAVGQDVTAGARHNVRSFQKDR